LTIAYRPAELTDAPIVVSLWSRGYKHCRQAGIIATEEWAPVMHRQFQRLLSRPHVRTIIAFENTSPSFIYGFIAGDTSWHTPVIYFTYVKEAYRRAGYARGLFAALGVDPEQPFRYVCFTPFIIKLNDKIPYAKHDPDLARYPSYDAPRRETHGTDEA
jgi:hypothetical protein